MPRGPQFKLGPNDRLDGKLVYDGDLRVEGTVRGDVSLTGDLTVTEKGVAEANIEGEEVMIRGRVTGKVVAKNRLRLLGRAALEGDVQAPRLSVEGGATLNGRVTMSPPGEGQA